jgi:RNA polymerase sigma-70 factor, ECF subfamily
MTDITLESVCQEAWRHREALSAYAYTWLKDWSRADDAVQEAYLVMLSKWQEVRSIDGVLPWIRRIVQFKMMNAHKAGRREVALSDDSLEAIAAEAVAQHIERDVDHQQARRVHALQRCLERIPEAKRNVLRGYYLDGQSCDQLAGDHGSNSNAVAKLLSRLRQTLRECTELHLRQELV